VIVLFVDIGGIVVYVEDSIDSSETSSILSQSTISDDELCDEVGVD
jgi:hypothetical protein